MKRKIYNLEFPTWCPEINIFGYRFYRIEDYEESIKKLQHLVTCFSEFEIKQNTGSHSPTAYVEYVEREERSILQWKNENSTALKDIMLLLSLFTGRDVFDVKEDFVEDNKVSITSDSRQYRHGGILRTSIPYEKKSIDDFIFFNIGFEKELNKIYKLMKTNEWQIKYGSGYYLLLAKQALSQQFLETSFIQCWTILEHLFAIHNKQWLSLEEIRRLNSSEKIAFLFNKYALIDNIDRCAKNRIKSLAKIRNRLVHYGRFPEEDSVYNDAELFINLTEFIIAKSLGLYPSNIFNTIEKLEEFLTRKT